MHRHAMILLCGVLVALVGAGGCETEKKTPRPAVPPRDEVPPVPVVSEELVRRAVHPRAELVGKGLVADVAPMPGQEALVVVRGEKGHHELVVVRGNHKVVARAPLGGRIMATAHVQTVGELHQERLAGLDTPLYLLPIETRVQRQWACGTLAFRFRSGALILVGEMGSRCWSATATGGSPRDPSSLYEIKELEGETRILMSEDGGKVRPWRWDEQQAALVSLVPIKR